MPIPQVTEARTQDAGNNSGRTRPLVSIICAVYNGEQHLSCALDSVSAQTYDNIELVVIDGGSTDSTTAILDQYGSKIDYWVSEHDKGIADAWNKGINHANGDIVGFLNADDYYDEDAVKRVIDTIGHRYDIPLVSYGNTRMMEDGQSGRYIAGRHDEKKLYYGFGFMHPSCFTTRAAIEKVGLFNPDIKIAMDTDWLVRCIKQRVLFIKSENLTYMRTGGVSERMEKAGFDEYLEVLRAQSYGPLFILYAKYAFLLKLGMRKLVGKRGMDRISTLFLRRNRA